MSKDNARRSAGRLINMKPVQVVVALVLGLIVSAVFLAISTHWFDNHERVGHFDVYTNPKVPDSSVHSTLRPRD